MAKTADQCVCLMLIDPGRCAVHSGLPAERLAQWNRRECLFPPCKKNSETARIKKIKSPPQPSSIRKGQLPPVPQVWSGLQRPIFSRIVKASDLRRVFRLGIRQKVLSSRRVKDPASFASIEISPMKRNPAAIISSRPVSARTDALTSRRVKE
jgi:hypothetical protein